MKKLNFYAWKNQLGVYYKPFSRSSPSFATNFIRRTSSLTRARKTNPPALLSAHELLAENPYTTTSTLAQAIMNASPLLTELIVVREWLQEIAPAPQRPEATTGYWKFTKHNVMQALRTGTGQRDGLVKEMDPDVVNRGGGRALSTDDTVSCIYVVRTL